MSDPNQPTTPPGWYPDGQGGQRWWDGTQWTEHTQPPAAPAAPSAPAAPAAPAAPSVPGADLPTQVAPNRATGYPQQGAPQHPQQPQQPQQPQPGYGAPAGGYGQPAGQPGGYGQPAGQPGWGQPPSGGGNGKLIAIIGGAVGALLLVLILVIVLFKVVLGGGPGDVAKDYLEAQADFDLERACELTSEKDLEGDFEEYDVDNCGDLVDAYEDEASDGELDDFEEYQDDFNVDIEIGDVTEKDETAEVEFTTKTEYDGDDEDLEDYFGEAQEVDGTLFLVKEDGDWKVDEDKSDSAIGF